MSINPKFDSSNVSIVPKELLRSGDCNADNVRRNDGIGLISLCYRTLMRWHMKRESRRALRDMTREQLLDIGLSPGEAAKEVSKSYFWD